MQPKKRDKNKDRANKVNRMIRQGFTDDEIVKEMTCSIQLVKSARYRMRKRDQKANFGLSQEEYQWGSFDTNITWNDLSSYEKSFATKK